MRMQSRSRIYFSICFLLVANMATAADKDMTSKDEVVETAIEISEVVVTTNAAETSTDVVITQELGTTHN